MITNSDVRPRVLSLILLGVLAAACATRRIQPLPVEPGLHPLLSFIHAGVTTREDVLLKLGVPSAQFEGQRILTYELRVDDRGELHVVWPQRNEDHPSLIRFKPDIYSLVLVFGPNAVLEKHSLVR